mmetsp:Transcript_12166/g.25210  ORF Transcript_12166/g.25210 Transcript_12166/m.25210 type:complete len:132 (-) Transcript_12166:802-1197(-)
MPSSAYLRLLDGITNGATIEINSTGTQLRFVPGMLVGGEVHHDCPVDRPPVTGASTSGSAGTGGGNPQDEEAAAAEGVLNPRSVGYYLKFLLPLSPFCKLPLNLRLGRGSPTIRVLITWVQVPYPKHWSGS